MFQVAGAIISCDDILGLNLPDKQVRLDISVISFFSVYIRDFAYNFIFIRS
jgi:hypothetical protein